MHHVTAGALLKDGSILLCHRTASVDWYPSVWDLPGGHIEPPETPFEALRRELQEELGVFVSEVGPPVVAATSEATVSIFTFTDWNGTIQNLAPEEHAEVRWIPLGKEIALPLGPLATHLIARLI